MAYSEGPARWTSRAASGASSEQMHRSGYSRPASSSLSSQISRALPSRCVVINPAAPAAGGIARLHTKRMPANEGERGRHGGNQLLDQLLHRGLGRAARPANLPPGRAVPADMDPHPGEGAQGVGQLRRFPGTAAPGGCPGHWAPCRLVTSAAKNQSHELHSGRQARKPRVVLPARLGLLAIQIHRYPPFAPGVPDQGRPVSRPAPGGQGSRPEGLPVHRQPSPWRGGN
jgi:hypothetical protein